jgi:hypothetical protein
MTNPSGALFLTYEELVENPLDTLARLQTFLDIEEGFSLRYDIQRFTGTRGDPSEAIKAGRIVADRVRLQTELPTGILTRARESHASCVEAMRRHHRADEAGATRDDARP